MARLTANQAEKINRMNPDAQAAALGSSVKETQDYAPVVISYDIEADATDAPTAFTAPFAMRIVDIIVWAKATVGGGAITPQKGSDAMCTAIACATNGAVTHMSAGAVVANAARLTLAAGDAVKVDAANAGDRGTVTFIGQRL
jgi:hypothetical protein